MCVCVWVLQNISGIFENERQLFVSNSIRVKKTQALTNIPCDFDLKTKRNHIALRRSHQLICVQC